MLIHPVREMDRLMRQGEGDFLESLWIFMAVVAALHFTSLHQALAFFEQRPLWVLQKLLDVAAFQGQSIFLFLASWVLVFYGASRIFLEKPLPIWSVFNAAAYLLLPFSFLLALGGVVSLAGVDHWSLPHHPIHSPTIWVQGEIQWFRYTLKSLITFLWPTAIGLGLVWRWKKARPVQAEPDGAPLGLAAWSLIMVMLWVGAWAQALTQGAAFKPVLVGDAFPKMNRPWLKARPSDLDGSINLGAQKGDILVIDFWASWCGPCMKALPELEDIAKTYKNKGVRVIGVNREPRDPNAAKEVLLKADPLFKSVVDSGALAQKLGLQVLPTTYLVDTGGKVRFLHLGALDAAALRQAIDGVLQAP
jgi:thiol-disulfide isomerase/thioredoxin